MAGPTPLAPSSGSGAKGSQPAGQKAAQQAQKTARQLFKQLSNSLQNQSGMVLVVVHGARIVCNMTIPARKKNVLKIPDKRPLVEGKPVSNILDNERDKNISPWQCKCKKRPSGNDYLPCDYKPAGTWTPGVQTENCKDLKAKFPNSDQAMQAMDDFMEDGFSLNNASSMMGNILQENDFFRADTEYGNGGAGRGWIQWSYSRRTEFEAYAAANGLDPTAYQTNYDYLMNEMAGNSFNGLNHWTGGGSMDRFKSIQDLDQGTRYFENNFERAGKPHMDRRLQRAQQAKDAYQKLKDLAIPEVALLRCSYGGIISIEDPNQRTKRANIGSCVAHMPVSPGKTGNYGH